MTGRTGTAAGSDDRAWIETRVTVGKERLEAVEEVLAQAGASAVTVAEEGNDRVVVEPGAAWAANRVTGLFPADALPADLEARLTRVAGRDVGVEWIPVVGTDWANAWKDHFSAFPVGQRLWVRPSWAPAGPPGGRVEVVLDPGMAFGTGYHPTTRLCLGGLESRLRPDSAPVVLDYGCGSGILAIAAAKLGATRVVAVDNDPAALEAIRTNAAANGVGERIEVRASEEGLGDSAPFPYVVANILSRTLMELAGELTEATAVGGELVLAGLLGPQADAVREAFPHFRWGPEVREGEWVRLDGVRREG